MHRALIGYMRRHVLGDDLLQSKLHRICRLTNLFIPNTARHANQQMLLNTEYLEQRKATEGVQFERVVFNVLQAINLCVARLEDQPTKGPRVPY